jgi:hypothetical protein
MPRYRLTAKAFIGNKLLDAGDTVEMPEGAVSASDTHLVLLDGKQTAADAKATAKANDIALQKAIDLRAKAEDSRAKSDAMPGRNDLAIEAAEAEAKADTAEAEVGAAALL